MKISAILKQDQISDKWRKLHSFKSKLLEMTDKIRLQLLIKNGKKIAVNYQQMALWHIALLQGRNGTQNMASSFMVVGWGTVQISTPLCSKTKQL